MLAASQLGDNLAYISQCPQ